MSTSGNNVVRYILSLESRQFLTEMSRARREARNAARGMSGDFGSAMGAAKHDAQAGRNAMMGFASAQSALSRAMSGDFVGACGSAAMAMKSLTAAMMTNPWFALLAAVVAVGSAIAKVAGSWIEYRERVAAAKAENYEFAASLAKVAAKWEAAADWKKFEKKLAASDGETIERAIAGQERTVERAWDRAIEASRDVRNAKERGAGKNYIEHLEERRDRAKENYIEQMGRLGTYREFLEAFHERQERQKGANKEELDRRAEEKAGDDTLKLMEVLKERRVEASRKYGGGEEKFEERLKAGTATEEEIRDRREIETLEKRILGIAHQRVEEARQLEKVERERAEAAAKAEAQAAEEARKRLNSSRESALVKAGRPEELEARANRMEAAADKRFGEWNDDKILKASQEELTARAEVERIRGLAEQARANRDGEREERKPWVEGVVAARGMSIGDVFSQMRGMNGAEMKDPNVEYNRRTSEGVGSMKEDMHRIAKALTGGGVQ